MRLSIRLLIFSLVICCNVNSQGFESKVLDFRKVKFAFLKTSIDLVDDSIFIPSTIIINVKLKKTDKLAIFNFKKDEWKKYLNNVNTSWATLLLLYEFHKKDASRFKVIKTYSIWKRTYYAEDLIYWNKFLDSN